MQQKRYQLGQALLSFILVVIASGVLIFATLSLIELQKQSRITLTGVVSSSIGKPVTNATISLQGQQSMSDNTGSYTFGNLKWGWNTLEAEADGYLSYKEDIYLPFGSQIDQPIQLENINYAILKGKIVADDTQLFEQNKANITLKINSTKVLVNADGSFETSKVNIQKVSVNIITPGFDDVYKIIELNPGINEMAPIPLQKSSAFGLQLKNVDTGKSLFNAPVLINDEKVSTDSDGLVDLTQMRFIPGDTISIKTNGFREQSFIYSKNLGKLEILLEQQSDAKETN
jgi:Carboxypeptidase regulatory-like domain